MSTRTNQHKNTQTNIIYTTKECIWQLCPSPNSPNYFDAFAKSEIFISSMILVVNVMLYLWLVSLWIFGGLFVLYFIVLNHVLSMDLHSSSAFVCTDENVFVVSELQITISSYAILISALTSIGVHTYICISMT